MDLLLVVSPVNARFKYMPFYYLYLAGHLEKFGYKVGIADPHFKKQKDNVNYVLNMVKENNPKNIFRKTQKKVYFFLDFAPK